MSSLLAFQGVPRAANYAATKTVRPGWLAKLLEGSLALLPRWGRVRAMALVMGGMTQHRA